MYGALLLVEVAAATALIGTIITLAVVQQRHTHQHQALRERVNRHLGHAMTHGPNSGRLESVGRLRPDMRIAVLAELQDAVTDTDRQQVTALLDTANLTARAIADCRSRRGRHRLRGLRWLGVLGGGGSTSPFLRDPNPRVRREAAYLTGVTGSPADVVHLVELLDDPDGGCRFAAADALCRVRNTAVAPLTGYLARPSSTHLAQALQVAAVLGAARLLQPACALTAHESAAVRRGVASVCAALGGELATTNLKRLLRDPNPEVRAVAAAGLGRLGQWTAAVTLAEVLTDADFDVRRAAGLSLWQLGGPGHIWLRRVTRGDDPFAADMAEQVLNLPRSARTP